MDDEDEGAEVIYCRYGQCADRTVPCPSCVRIVVGDDSQLECLCLDNLGVKQ
jgi:hypothetical protein